MAPIDRLPLEVLGACFGFLPFRDRLAATLVSHTWRASALSAPWLWSDIEISSRMESPMDTLALVLPRTGKRSVVLKVCQSYGLSDLDQDSFTAVLSPHMDHLMFIEMEGLSWPFEHPAPALESFTLVGSTEWPLTENFMGGELGKLRRLDIDLVSFPEICPAVTTVTELTLGLGHMEGINGLSDLFTLFPQLRSLTFFDIEPGQLLILRELRPPFTLSTFRVWTEAVDIDLLDFYNSWSEHLTDVVLNIYQCQAEGFHLTSFLSDALALIVDMCDSGAARIVVLDSRTRKRTLLLRRGYHDALLHDAHGRLAHVHSLTISATVLYELLILGPFALPALRHITLALDQRQDRCQIEPVGKVTSYLWPWRELGKLSAFLRSLEVETLTLEMRCLSRETPPTLEDGRKLLSEYVLSIADPEARPARRLRVRGFPRKVADALSSELRALQLDCDVGIVVYPSSMF